jgi:hypothetical protein
MRWEGYVERTGYIRSAYTSLVEETERRNALGRLKCGEKVQAKSVVKKYGRNTLIGFS